MIKSQGPSDGPRGTPELSESRWDFWLLCDCPAGERLLMRMDRAFMSSGDDESSDIIGEWFLFSCRQLTERLLLKGGWRWRCLGLKDGEDYLPLCHTWTMNWAGGQLGGPNQLFTPVFCCSKYVNCSSLECPHKRSSPPSSGSTGSSFEPPWVQIL